MAIGTAGFTAMLCVDALLNHGIKPEDGPVLVTGASGGVGSIAAMILASMGYRVTASTGRPEEATGSIKRSVWTRLLTVPSSPVPENRYRKNAGLPPLIQSVAIRSAMYAPGCVMAVLLQPAAWLGMELMGNVAPFILRGVTLKGIDSVMFAKEKKSGDLAAGGTVFTGVQTG